MVLENNGEDQFDRSCEVYGVFQRVKGGRSHPTCDKTQECSWVGLVLHSNRFVQHVIEEIIKMTGGRGRRCKQLPDDFKEMRNTRSHSVKGLPLEEAMDLLQDRLCNE